jgi:hypothetical protein
VYDAAGVASVSGNAIVCCLMRPNSNSRPPLNSTRTVNTDGATAEGAASASLVTLGATSTSVIARDSRPRVRDRLNARSVKSSGAECAVNTARAQDEKARAIGSSVRARWRVPELYQYYDSIDDTTESCFIYNINAIAHMVDIALVCEANANFDTILADR